MEKIQLNWSGDKSEREYEVVAKIEFVDHESNRGYGGPDVRNTTFYRDSETGLLVGDVEAFEEWIKAVSAR